MSNKWKSVIAEKRARQLASIPKEWIFLPDELPAPRTKTNLLEFPRSCTRLLSPKELEITESSVDTLLSNLANALWSSVEVTTAFYKRAIIAHQLVNCLTEIFVDRALQRAQELDSHLSSTGKVIGPLHGLPISLKDQINISGLESTMGYVSWVGVYPENNATLVDTLVSLGAVPFVKTNVPQTLMWGETFNNLFGRTSNPYNKSLTSGGSSGGEGALIAMKGSPLGVGSDIGGSIRIPSAFCGIYGLRPSAGRIPYGGCVNSMEGQDSIQSVLGPMSNSLQGLKIFTQAVIQAKTWRFDPLVIAKPWSEEEYKLVNHGNGQDLCFGIMWNDGDIVPHPPIIRGLELVKKALLEAGHQVTDWKPINHAGIAEIADKVWAAGDMDDYRAILKLTDEPLVGSMDPEVLNEEGYHTGVDLPHDGTSAYELWQVQKQRKTLRQQYLSHWEKTTGATGTGRPIDAIICPVAPYAAPPHGKNRITQYTKVWNVLDYPSLVLPVTAVDELLDEKGSLHQFNNLRDEENHRLYDPTVFHGAPVAVQVVARTLEDEAVIAMAEIVDAAVRSYGSK